MKAKKLINLLLCLVLVITISGGIILGTQLIYKKNHKTQEDIMAEKNQIKLGNEEVFYVDLTKKPEDYEKISNEDEESEIENIPNQTSNEETTKTIATKINQDYYDVEVDLNSGKIIADGKEEDITNLVKTAEEKEKLYNYINENAIGDVTNENGKRKIQNPYSTKTIMMETDKINQLNNCGNVESIVRVSDDIYCVHYKDTQSTKEGYDLLKNNELVSNVAKDAKVSALDIEDTNSQVEELQVSGDNYAWGVQSTGISQYVNKLNFAKNNTDVKVAVLDTGVRTTHEVFKNEETADRLDLTSAYNYVGSNSDITDDNGHGTMVAGIIAESTSNNVKIVPIKVLGSDGKGDYSVAIQALTAIIDKVDVVNVSLGIDESELPSSTKAMGEKMLKPVYDSGKVIVCASGNDGKESVYYPASSQYTIAVSAIDSQKNISSFSNYGSTVDFAAPGQGLILPYYTGDNLYNSSFASSSAEYQKNSGTSFASPFVVADFAMLKSENKNYTVEEMKNILINNCEDLGETGKDKYYGYGNVNFDTNMFAKPVIASVNISEDENQNNKIELYAVGGNKITNWSYTSTDEEPTDESAWRAFSSPAKSVHITLTSQKTSKDQKYYIWIKDETNNIVKQEVTVEGTHEEDNNTTNTDNTNSNTTNTDNTNNNTTTNTDNTNSNTTTNTDNTNSNTTTNTDNTNSNTTTNTDSNTTTNTDNTNSNTTTNTDNTNSNTTTNTDNTNSNTTNTTDNTTTNTNTDNTNSNTTTNTDNTNSNTTNTENTNSNTTNTNTDNTNNNTNDTNENTENTNSNISGENTNNNSTIGGITNTSNKNNTSIDSIKVTQDNSKTSKILPKTGTDKIIVLAVVVIVLSGIFTFIKYKKLKDVK